ncbi:MAG TPA: LacI family DNA-binding transcriptional regulator [Candidatus Methylomirabilis sp.]|nr:LacI family DNA-binding transcriptional regulator [Candidatus Methylomirabilis sp.]
MITDRKPNRQATRADVARRARVSVATVSYVINDGPRPVATATRERVLRAIRRLDYRPSEVARSLRLQKTRTIGLILPDTANPFYAALAKGVEDTGFTRGYSVLLCHSDYDAAREQAYAEVLISKQVDGVIYIQATPDPSAVRRLLNRRIPTVAVDREIPDLEIDCVVADNFGGSRAATEHLLALGHRRIGCFVRASSLSNATERVRGYQAAMAEAGLPATPDLFVSSGHGYEDGRKAMAQLLGVGIRPTAVLAYPDTMAIGAIRASLDAGLQVPEQMSVVGFDDIPSSAFIHPPLTTVSMPKWEMGQRAAEVLLTRIGGGETGRPSQRLVLPTTLIVRESTAPPSTKS